MQKEDGKWEAHPQLVYSVGVLLKEGWELKEEDLWNKLQEIRELFPEFPGHGIYPIEKLHDIILIPFNVNDLDNTGRIFDISLCRQVRGSSQTIPITDPQVSLTEIFLSNNPGSVRTADENLHFLNIVTSQTLDTYEKEEMLKELREKELGIVPKHTTHFENLGEQLAKANPKESQRRNTEGNQSFLYQ